MITAALIATLGIIAIYIRQTFPGMIQARQWGDLAVNCGIIALYLYSLPCFIFGMSLPDLASILSGLLRLPVQLIYGPWM